MKSIILAVLLFPLFGICQEPDILIYDQQIVEEIGPLIDLSYTIEKGKLTIQFSKYMPGESDYDEEERYYIDLPYTSRKEIELTSENIEYSYIRGRRMVNDENSKLKKLSISIIRNDRTVSFQGTLDYVPQEGMEDKFSNELLIDMELPITQEINDRNYFFIDDTLKNYHVRPVLEEPVQFPDVDPEFPGGMKGMLEYMNENLKYPPSCAEMGIQGKVYLSFIIEKDGSTSNVNLLRGVHSDLDREAIRLIKEMPKWKPGEMDGQVKVRTLYRIPVYFKLSN